MESLPQFSHLLSFSWFLVVSFVYAICGGIAMAVIDFIAKLRKVQVTQELFLAGIGLSFVVGMFIEWQSLMKTIDSLKEDKATLNQQITSQNQQIAGLNQQIIDFSKPRFNPRIETIFTAQDVTIDTVHIEIQMSITNTGAPSIAQGFRLNIGAESVSVTNLVPDRIPDKLQLRDPSTGRIIAELQQSDAIYEKTVKPIERGGLVRGWLVYNLKGGQLLDQVTKAGTKFTVVFTDVSGNRYETSQVMKANPDPVMYYPGTRNPFLSPPETKKKGKK